MEYNIIYNIYIISNKYIKLQFNSLKCVFFRLYSRLFNTVFYLYSIIMCS